MFEKKSREASAEPSVVPTVTKPAMPYHDGGEGESGDEEEACRGEGGADMDSDTEEDEVV